MDIYQRKSRWKWYLGIAGVVIVAISMAFVNYLTTKLAQEERKKVEVFLTAYNQVTDADLSPNADLTLHLEIINSNTTIPLILVSGRDNIMEYRNISDTTGERLQRELAEMREAGIEPIDVAGSDQKLYYKQSTLLTLLQYFPIFQLVLISAFIIFGYLGFSAARRSEQNRVWVGMAKETAHQLGTPITAIVGWIDHLRMLKENDEEVQEVVDELHNDVGRLELIADRFSKIGSAPELKPINIYEELQKCRAYMQRRAPRKVQFVFPAPEENHALPVHINPPLFDWVVENLLRNALDAMDGKGEIRADVYDDGNYINVDLTDTGKGIPASKFKSVFQPGYTTKQRGWGLGLSLAKRIIEQYHSGKIFVSRSEEGVGTTFTIRLPKK